LFFPEFALVLVGFWWLFCFCFDIVILGIVYMGDCCSKDGKYGGSNEVDMDEMEDDIYDGDDINYGDAGARIRLQGPSRFVSMYSQQGKKGINQDSMTVWEVHCFVLYI
jgi:hypothetical protein